jgi:hypothetical protein
MLLHQNQESASKFDQVDIIFLAGDSAQRPWSK